MEQKWFGILVLVISLWACAPVQEVTKEEVASLREAKATFEDLYGLQPEHFDQTALSLIQKAEALNLQPETGELCLLYARYLLREQRYAEAFGYLNQVLNHPETNQHPDLLAGVLINLSYIYEQLGQKEVAITYLEDCLLQATESKYYPAWAHARLALLYKATDEEGHRHIAEAKELLPHIANTDRVAAVTSILSEWLRREKREAEAIEILRQVPAESLSAYRSAYHYNKLGHLYLMAGSYQEAIIALQYAQKQTASLHSPRLELWVHCNLARAWEPLGKQNMAIQSLEEAVKLAPQFMCLDEGLTFAYTQLATYYIEEGRESAAMAVREDYAGQAIRMAQNQSALLPQFERLKISLQEEQLLAEKEAKVATQQYWLSIAIAFLLFVTGGLLTIRACVRYKRKVGAQAERLTSGISAALQVLQSTEDERKRFLSKS